MLTLYDAARCPYCARVRIVLAEKEIPYDLVAIDLSDRPAWLYEKNSTGRVPVLEEDGGFLLPESLVIVEYLEERFPEPALMPPDPAERALVRLRLRRASELTDPYYDLMMGRADEAPLHEALARLDRDLEARPYLSGSAYGLADVGYLPWILRAETRLGVDLSRHEALVAWRDRLAERPAVRAELDLLATV